MSFDVCTPATCSSSQDEAGPGGPAPASAQGKKAKLAPSDPSDRDDRAASPDLAHSDGGKDSAPSDFVSPSDPSDRDDRAASPDLAHSDGGKDSAPSDFVSPSDPSDRDDRAASPDLAHSDGGEDSAPYRATSPDYPNPKVPHYRAASPSDLSDRDDRDNKTASPASGPYELQVGVFKAREGGKHRAIFPTDVSFLKLVQLVHARFRLPAENKYVFTYYKSPNATEHTEISSEEGLVEYMTPGPRQDRFSNLTVQILSPATTPSDPQLVNVEFSDSDKKVDLIFNDPDGANFEDISDAAGPYKLTYVYRGRRYGCTEENWGECVKRLGCDVFLYAEPLVFVSPVQSKFVEGVRNWIGALQNAWKARGTPGPGPDTDLAGIDTLKDAAMEHYATQLGEADVVDSAAHKSLDAVGLVHVRKVLYDFKTRAKTACIKTQNDLNTRALGAFRSHFQATYGDPHCPRLYVYYFEGVCADPDAPFFMGDVLQLNGDGTASKRFCFFANLKMDDDNQLSRIPSHGKVDVRSIVPIGCYPAAV